MKNNAGSVLENGRFSDLSWFIYHSNILVVVSATDDFLYVGAEHNGLEGWLANNGRPSQRSMKDENIHVHIGQCRIP